ncbi:GntR family transcriptional regulator [Mitsuaria sp. GD03876]|uniref:GntR family transcriptional regulator n=1 Tax=Mitsuaria sp. GD03876 TaxID=2975399 RepID=UPI00244AF9EC|nr:GntR family transcriptional regulator [Mitsuaria sp. GD03876]MDH0864565.1 GntR family transcriptional regulator [Mitsuaria sp. GD03876]
MHVPSSSAELIALPSAPLHARIKEILRGRILDGSYPPLSQLPSESELGVAFGVSRITLRQALAALQREGLIYTLQGKGSFVSRPKAFQNVSSLMGFAESMSAMGYEVLNQLQGLRFLDADREVAARLNLAEGAPVAEIRRVRLLNREPVSLEITYVPAAIGKRLAQADLVTRDIFLILENECGLPLGHADLKIDATLADAELAATLGIGEGAPVLRIERLTHDASGTPIDFEYLHFRADAFQYRLRVDRHRQER